MCSVWSVPKSSMLFCFLQLRNNEHADIDTKFSGTTAVMCTILGNVLTCANVGDSRVILGMLNDDGQLVVDEVSNDHKPDNPAEKKRIEEAGGRVFAVTYEDGIDGPVAVPACEAAKATSYIETVVHVRLSALIVGAIKRVPVALSIRPSCSGAGAEGMATFFEGATTLGLARL